MPQSCSRLYKLTAVTPPFQIEVSLLSGIVTRAWWESSRFGERLFHMGRSETPSAEGLDFDLSGGE